MCEVSGHWKIERGGELRLVLNIPASSPRLQRWALERASDSMHRWRCSYSSILMLIANGSSCVNFLQEGPRKTQRNAFFCFLGMKVPCKKSNILDQLSGLSWSCWSLRTGMHDYGVAWKDLSPKGTFFSSLPQSLPLFTQHPGKMLIFHWGDSYVWHTLGNCSASPQEQEGELGLWISKGRLEQLVGCEEAAELVHELPQKPDPASGRPLFFYVEERVEHKALWG